MKLQESSRCGCVIDATGLRIHCGPGAPGDPGPELGHFVIRYKAEKGNRDGGKQIPVRFPPRRKNGKTA
jgi:hypothetical protein